MLHKYNSVIVDLFFQEHVAVWSGKKLIVYSFSQDKEQTRIAGIISILHVYMSTRTCTQSSTYTCT